jgi:hypothetical protein
MRLFILEENGLPQALGKKEISFFQNLIKSQLYGMLFLNKRQNHSILI